MPAKHCDGRIETHPTDRESDAYCAGREAAANGVAYTPASATTGVEVNNNGLTWTAFVDSDGVGVELIDPSANDQELRVVLSQGPLKVQVYLATSGAGAITSTAAEVLAAVNADPVANMFVSAAHTGASTGAAAVVAESVTLTGKSGTTNQPVGMDSDLWVRGHQSWSANPANRTAQDCCAHAYGGGYTP